MPLAANPDYAWIVNFNNGNVNNYNRDNNNACVRAVRPSECQGEVSLKSLYCAWENARRRKLPSHNQVAFETRSLDRLFQIQGQLNNNRWHPLPSHCFTAKQPKAREIHAPDFADRVVHHWLVPQLEAVFERGFIHDSYSNRPGKGTHAAVERLQTFVRQVNSGQGGGWYLQLDIKNFFNSIHRPTLWAMLKTGLQKATVSHKIMRTTHALLRSSPLSHGVIHHSSSDERAKVPAHKRLESAASGCGLPIGNLSSQFFANVYMDALDQFVKHQLKVPRYLRYVDDFVLVHQDREQLQTWLPLIQAFLQKKLGLELKADIKLRPLNAGIDFLGYIIHPTHNLVRRRVISHAREKLAAWGNRHVSSRGIRATPLDLRNVCSIWSSYEGHFLHAASFRLRQDFHRRFPWLVTATARRKFHHNHEGQHFTIRVNA